jgi:hypothetical protein
MLKVISFGKAFLMVTALLGATNMVNAKSMQPVLPTIVSARVPSYPALAKLQKAQGIVKMRLTTDGHKVITVEPLEGHPALIKAAKANVETWEFQEHKAITFETIFAFAIKVVPPCEPNDERLDVITLRLPASVEIRATWQGECDPIVENK